MLWIDACAPTFYIKDRNTGKMHQLHYDGLTDVRVVKANQLDYVYCNPDAVNDDVEPEIGGPWNGVKVYFMDPSSGTYHHALKNKLTSGMQSAALPMGIAQMLEITLGFEFDMKHGHKTPATKTTPAQTHIFLRRRRT